MYTISLTPLSLISQPLVVGLFTTFPLKYIVDEPPPSKLYTVLAPSEAANVASS